MSFEMMRDTNACPMDKPMAVKNKGTGKLMSCHPDEAAAKRQMAALMKTTVKDAVQGEAKRRGMA